MRRRTTLKGMLATAVASLVPARIQAASDSSSGSTHHTIEIGQFKFSPASLSVRTGDHITWINRDIVPHTATADDGSWDTGEIGTNASSEIVISADFGQSYYCRFHPSMKANVSIA